MWGVITVTAGSIQEKGGGLVLNVLTSTEKLETDRQANIDRRFDRHTPISYKQEELKDRRERQTGEIKIHRQTERRRWHKNKSKNETGRRR
jgi:hypothetical protein